MRIGHLLERHLWRTIDGAGNPSGITHSASTDNTQKSIDFSPSGALEEIEGVPELPMLVA